MQFANFAVLLILPEDYKCLFLKESTCHKLPECCGRVFSGEEIPFSTRKEKFVGMGFVGDSFQLPRTRLAFVQKDHLLPSENN
jgi:hypothetical protein